LRVQQTGYPTTTPLHSSSVIYRSSTKSRVPKHTAGVRGLFQISINAFVLNGWDNSKDTSLSLDKTQTNRHSLRVPLGRDVRHRTLLYRRRVEHQACV